MPEDETPTPTQYVMTFTASGVVGTTNPDEKDES